MFLLKKNQMFIFIISEGNICRISKDPLDKSTLDVARLQRKKELRYSKSLRQVIVTCMFMWLVVSISYSNRDVRSYDLYRHIETMMVTAPNKTFVSFNKVNIFTPGF